MGEAVKCSGTQCSFEPTSSRIWRERSRLGKLEAVGLPTAASRFWRFFSCECDSCDSRTYQQERAGLRHCGDGSHCADKVGADAGYFTNLGYHKLAYALARDFQVEDLRSKTTAHIAVTIHKLESGNLA